MSDHHHHCHNHQSPSSSCCCCTTTLSFHCCRNTTPPNHTNTDQLLQTLILLQSQPPPIFLKSYPQPQNPPPHRSKPKYDDYGDLSSLLRSLVRRVAALESSSSSHFSPLPPKQRRLPLRDAAAATIQRQFRRFLARRSRILRDVKQLASIKSHAAALRSSISDKALRNPGRISERAEDLLSQLDSIQNSDSMIQEGERSVRRELIRILEFVDKVLAKESNGSQSQLEEVERRRDRRRVSFAESNGREDNLFDDFPARITDIEKEASRGFCDLSSDNEESGKAMRHERVNGFSQRMAPPLPVRMELIKSRSMKKMVADEED